MSNRSSTLGDSVRRHAFHRIAQNCLTRAHAAARRRIMMSAIGGIILVTVCPVIIGLLLRLTAHVERITANRLLLIWAGVTTVGALIAVVCRYQGMDFKETTSKVTEDSLNHVDATDDNPIAAFLILMVLAVATGGMWLILHAIADWFTGWRLRKIDPTRAGVIMSELFSANTDVPASRFIKVGESTKAFRIYPAYLHWLRLIRVYPQFGTLTTTPFARRLLTAA